MFESVGAQNIITKTDKFATPNAAEGLKVYGTMEIPVPNTDKFQKSNYAILGFTSENVIQQVLVAYKEHDIYAEKMTERILNSVELKEAEE